MSSLPPRSATPQWDPHSDFDELAHGHVASGAGTYQPIIERCPVSRYDNGEGVMLWTLLGYAEVERAISDVETFSNDVAPDNPQRILPLMADPPEHTAYKRMFTRFFRPNRIALAEERVRPIAAAMLDPLIERGSSEFAADYAYAFSTRVLCDFLGVEEDWRIYNDWSKEMERLTGSGTLRSGQGIDLDHFAKIVPYLQDLIAQRRAEPGEDPVSGFVAGEVEGQPLTDEAMVGLIIALILAGRSTTASGIGNVVLRIADDEELQRLLRADPSRIPDAIEEVMRLNAPQQEMARRCTRDVEVAGTQLRAGDPVILVYGAANLDPTRWPDADRFDIDRPDKRRHLAFGRGTHQCPGAPLGRMEMRVTVEELLRRTDWIARDGEVERLTWPRLSAETLPLRLTASARVA